MSNYPAMGELKGLNINQIKATEDDIKDILGLYPRASEKQLIKIKEDVSRDVEDMIKGNRIIYSAEINNKVIGSIQLIFKMEKEYYANGNGLAHLHHTRVSKEFRGKGIGSELVGAAEEEAQKKGFKALTLGVEDSNTKAIKLYRKIGYREFMKEKGDEGETIIGMKKNL